MTITEPFSVEIGRLGLVSFDSARYVYVGSARGPGGLRARLARHLRRDKTIRWHIDYLTSRVRPDAVCFSVTSRRLECRWVLDLSRMPGVDAPIPRFGSSDCKQSCPAHLLRACDTDIADLRASFASSGEPVSIWRRV